MGNIGKMIQDLMDSRKPPMLQRDLEKKTGITQGFLSQIINGKKLPGIVNLKKIADALGVPVEEFFKE